MDNARFSIRSARAEDADGIAAVHITSWKTTYKGLIPGSYLDSLSHEDRSKMWRDAIIHPSNDQKIFVAMDLDAKIVGFICVGRNREKDLKFDGEIYALYLLESEQSQGIGKNLFVSGTNALKKAGMNSAFLWVLTENPARFFYEKMGAKIVTSRPTEIGGVWLEELGYAWSKI